MAGNTPTVPTKAYEDVKAWIAYQQAYETKHKKPAPLTSAQRKALEALRIVTPAGVPPTIDPNTNFVGILNEKCQSFSGVGDPEYTEGELGIAAAGGAPGRTCRVAIPQSIAHPRKPPKNGFPTGELPIYSTKKLAKQYAAYCALNWLDGKTTPENTSPGKEDKEGAVSSPKAKKKTAVANSTVGKKQQPTGFDPAPTQKKSTSQRKDDADDDNGDDDNGDANSSSSLTQNQNNTTTATTAAEEEEEASPPSSSKSSRRSSSSSIDGGSDSSTKNVNEEGDQDEDSTIAIPATELVARLCSKLHIKAPKYIITPFPEGSNTFMGSPDFDDQGDEDLATLRASSIVTGGVSRESTRQEVAALLVRGLWTIKKERQAQLLRIMAE